MPKNITTDWDKFLAGKRDNWDVEKLEVFLVNDPISKPRYVDVKTSLVNMSKNDVRKQTERKANHSAYIEQLLQEQEQKNNLFKKEEEKSEDSLLEHDFLYKEFLDEDQFKSKLREQFSVLNHEGDLKITTKIKNSSNIDRFSLKWVSPPLMLFIGLAWMTWWMNLQNMLINQVNLFHHGIQLLLHMRSCLHGQPSQH